MNIWDLGQEAIGLAADRLADGDRSRVRVEFENYTTRIYVDEQLMSSKYEVPEGETVLPGTFRYLAMECIKCPESFSSTA